MALSRLRSLGENRVVGMAFKSYRGPSNPGPRKSGPVKAIAGGPTAATVARATRCLAFVVILAGAVGGCASNSPQDNNTPNSEQAPSGQQSPSSSAVGAETAADANDDFEPTVVAARDYSDPLISVNRAIFSFNEISYRYVLFPLGKGYTHLTPDPVQRGLSNFFYNIKAPIYLVNNALQLKPRDAGINIARFCINSTIGLLGFFDPAKHWFGLERANTSFDETLMHYGAGYGFYIVIPFLGPSDLRNGTSVLVEGLFHPVSYVSDDRDRLLIQGLDYFQEFAPQVESFESLMEQSDDPYIFMRNFYLQGIQRDADYLSD